MRTILLLGPDLTAVSGISTHLNQLLASEVARRFRALHFQVGSEGRDESRIGKLWRALVSPVLLLWLLLRHRPEIVHINTAMEPKAFWRDLVYLLIARACGRRIVYQVHGGMLPEEFARGSVDYRVSRFSADPGSPTRFVELPGEITKLFSKRDLKKGRPIPESRVSELAPKKLSEELLSR